MPESLKARLAGENPSNETRKRAEPKRQRDEDEEEGGDTTKERKIRAGTGKSTTKQAGGATEPLNWDITADNYDSTADRAPDDEEDEEWNEVFSVPLTHRERMRIFGADFAEYAKNDESDQGEGEVDVCAEVSRMIFEDDGPTEKGRWTDGPTEKGRRTDEEHSFSAN